MPYLEYLFCEHCGNYARLDINMEATIEAYRADGRKQVAIIQPTLIWDYLIYSCGICRNQYKYTYRDVEFRVREYFSSLSEEFKDYFDAAVNKAEGGEGELPIQLRQSPVAERVRKGYTAKK